MFCFSFLFYPFIHRLCDCDDGLVLVGDFLPEARLLSIGIILEKLVMYYFVQYSGNTVFT